MISPRVVAAPYLYHAEITFVLYFSDILSSVRWIYKDKVIMLLYALI
jgi:hypothetical protein